MKLTKEYNFAVLFPEIAKQWNYNKNGDLKPTDFTPNSHETVWWSCDNGHEWDESIKTRTRMKTGCPFCSNHRVCKENCLATTHPEIAKQWDYTKNGNITPEMVVYGSNKEFGFICDKGHKWDAVVCERTINKHNCPFCANQKVCKDNCLATMYPEIAKQWDYAKNGDITPEMVIPGSNKIFGFICDKGHKWDARLSKRTKSKQNCPICANKKVYQDNCLATTHPEIASEWDYSKNGNLSPSEFTAGSGEIVNWKCNCCGHEWKSPIVVRKNGKNCSNCEKIKQMLKPKENSLEETHPHLAKQWSNKNFLKPNQVTAGSNKEIIWQCDKVKEHEWTEIICNRVKRSNCPFCSNQKVCQDNCLATTHPNLLKRWDFLKNIISPYEVTYGSTKKMFCKCPKCNQEWQATIGSMTRKNDVCPFCSGKRVYAGNSLATHFPKLVIEWHKTKNGNLTPHDVTCGSSKIVWWQCQNCGYEWKTTITHRTGDKTACPHCCQPKEQNLLFEIVKSLLPNKTVLYCYKHPDLRFKRSGWKMELDIFIPELNFAIEYQGIHHFKQLPNRKNLVLVQAMDKEKKLACIEHNINLQEVVYTWKKDKESIEKLLKQEKIIV